MLGTVLLAGWLAGCGGQQYSYRSGREIPPGPGLFTGAEGAVVIGIGDAPAEREGERKPAEGLPPARPPAGGYAPAE